MFRGISWRHFDFWLLGVIVLAIAFGVAMIRSAIAGNTAIANSVNRQMQFALVGLFVIVLVAGIDYRYWTALYIPMYIVMMILLIMIYFSAQSVFGAARWFNIAGLFIQPTELAKVVEVLILARYFEMDSRKPALGVGTGDLDPAPAQPEQRDCDDGYLGRDGLDQRCADQAPVMGRAGWYFGHSRSFSVPPTIPT
jgi:hypothetical protein